MTKINLNKNQSIILASLITVVPKQRRRLKSHYHPLDKPKPLYEKLLINKEKSKISFNLINI